MTNRFLFILLFNVIAIEASDKIMDSPCASSSSNFTLDGFETDEKKPFTIVECAIDAKLVNSYPIRSSLSSTLGEVTTKVLSPALSAISQSQAEKKTNGSEDTNDFVVIEDYQPKTTEEKLKEALKLHIENAAKIAVLEEKGQWQEQQIQLLEIYKSDIDTKLRSKIEQLIASHNENDALSKQLKTKDKKLDKTEANLICVQDALNKRIGLTKNLYSETADKDKQIKNTQTKLASVKNKNDELFEQIAKKNKELENTQTNLSQATEELTKSTNKFENELSQINTELVKATDQSEELKNQIVEKEKQLLELKSKNDEIFKELKSTQSSLEQKDKEYQNFLNRIEYSTKLDIAKTIIKLYENKIINYKNISNEVPEDKSAKFFITKAYNSIQDFIDNPKENHENFISYLNLNYYNIYRGSSSKNLSSLFTKLENNQGVFMNAENFLKAFKCIKEEKYTNNYNGLYTLLNMILKESIYMKEQITKNIKLIYAQIKDAPVCIVDISEVETAMTKHYTYESEALNDLAHNSIIINNTMQEIRNGMDRASSHFPKDRRLF